MATREHLARALWTLFEPIHAVTYFSAQSGASHLFIAYAGGVAAIIASGFLLAVLANRVFRALA